MRPLPTTAIELVQQLDAEVPARCPNINDSEREIWAYVGMRHLVESLLARLNADPEDLDVSI